MRRTSAALRRRVERRTRGLCEYCHSCAEYTGHDFTVDRILPESRCGTTTFDNPYWCCFWCNNFKQARTKALGVRSCRFVPLFNLRTEVWSDHFRWSRDETRVVGRSPVGRATIEALRLSRPYWSVPVACGFGMDCILRNHDWFLRRIVADHATVNGEAPIIASVSRTRTAGRHCGETTIYRPQALLSRLWIQKALIITVPEAM